MRTVVVVLHPPTQDPLQLQEKEERMQEEWKGKRRESKMGGEVALSSVLTNKMEDPERTEALPTSNFKSHPKQFPPAPKIVHFALLSTLTRCLIWPTLTKTKNVSFQT